MSRNPFSFTEPNTSHLISSEAILRAEIAKLRRDNLTLQREVREANDANGVAQAQVAFKNKIQEANRETKRAQIAERIARDLVATLRNDRAMPQESNESTQDAMELKKEPLDPNKIAQSRPADAPTSNDYTQVHHSCILELENAREQAQLYEKELRAHNKREKDLHTTHHQLNTALREKQNELDRADKTVLELETQLDNLSNKREEDLQAAHHDATAERSSLIVELQDYKTRCNELELELEKRATEASTAQEGLEKLQKDISKSQEEAQSWTDKASHLVEINNNLRADLNSSINRSSTLARELDKVKVHLADTEHTLQQTTASEILAREAYLSREREIELAESIRAETDADLQKNNDDLIAQMEEFTEMIATKDTRIQALKQIITGRKSGLEEDQPHDSSDEYIDRAIALREVSAGGNMSLFEELDAEDLGRYFDSGDGRSEISNLEDMVQTADLKLSAVTSIVIDSDTRTGPVLTASACDPSPSASPHHGFSFREVPQSEVLDKEHNRSGLLELSFHTCPIAHVAPFEPGLPALRLSEITTQSCHPVALQPALLCENTSSTSESSGISQPPNTPSLANEKLHSNGKVQGTLHILLTVIIVILLWYWQATANQLLAWENANGFGFGFSEGQGINYEFYGPYGNGHYLLGRLPNNLLSADSPLPIKAVKAIIGTVSSFENLIGYGSGPEIL
ncbi:hypothetical protein E8E13_011343 [Curvularia kusanoi]|uniref:Uncharacterized protein n=1 Tax=Curvularia kusanoi TaxID=90978 RepID=A0A9P4WBR7_CURKU|nr:hypothetical protein E8E13_011343 [Curvularia kusanoi]